MFAKPLIELDAALLDACRHATVITASERFERALRDAYDAHQADAGVRVWQRARVVTLATYLRQRYLELKRISQSREILLGTQAQRLVWLDQAPDAVDADLNSIYDQIAHAWHLAHDWDLIDSVEQFPDNENHRLFRRWALRYRRAAERSCWITEAELPQLIAEAMNNGVLASDASLFLGFDVVPPSLARLVDAMRRSGASATIHQTHAKSDVRPQGIACDTVEHELYAAIRWARDLLLESREPLAIGIAVPDVSARRDGIVRQLEALLRPSNRELDPAPCPYEVSGDVTLAARPVVADALELMQWTVEPLHYSRVDALLRSPFLALHAYASLAVHPELPESYDAATFFRRFPDLPLREIVGRSTGPAAPLDVMIATIRSMLASAGWPGAADLSKETIHAQQAFMDLLGELAAAAPHTRPRDFAATLVVVHDATQRSSFAPSRPNVALHVFDHVETSGFHFTHLWVTGLADLDWPSRPRPTPYIPLRLLRSAGVPRIDADSEFTFALRMSEQWASAGRHVIFSHPRVLDDHTTNLSKVLRVPEIAAAPRPGSGHPFLIARRPAVALIAQHDASAGRIEALHHHGSEILRDQSACGFRAYARYRLDLIARAPPHSFPDASERGVLTHLALRLTYESLGMEARIDVDDPSVAEVVSAAVEAALSGWRRFPRAFLETEHRRFASLILEWLRFEQGRLPGRIVASEYPTSLLLGDAKYELRIDRVDQLDSGGAMVIDYKTGAFGPVAVLGERPEEPQLAMYALSIPNVDAIACARIKRDDYRITGWANHSALPDGTGTQLRSPPPPFQQGWQNLLESWRTTLTRLSDEFSQGVADVAPRDTKVCRQCDLHALCRVRERDRTIFE